MYKKIDLQQKNHYHGSSAVSLKLKQGNQLKCQHQPVEKKAFIQEHLMVVSFLVNEIIRGLFEVLVV